MRQCALARGSTMTVAWIPVEFAVPGRMLDLKGQDRMTGDLDKWSCGWMVAQVFATRLPEFYVRDHERDYKHQREASDI
mgnify:FL=1